MKIGIDLLPLQSPGSRLRGVGRYGRELVANLLNRRDGDEYVLYAHEGFTREHLPDHDAVRSLELQTFDRLASDNPDKLDTLLILNPFELCPGYEPPFRPRNGLKIAAVVYDFIPFLDQEHYLGEPGNATRFYRRLRTIARYDHLLAISDATRDDAVRLLNFDPARISNISGASDSAFFAPDRSFPMPLAARQTLSRFGVGRPFVLSVAGIDERKNVRGLIDGFAALPLRLRSSHQLVITCHLKPDDSAPLRQFAEDRGMGESLVLTGEVTDAELRTLYQRCAAFAFPSLYEGLGLPLLEAMHCGAPVLAGRNSSQIEIVGDSGLLVNAAEPSEIASGLSSLLSDPKLACDLGAKGRARAAMFTWDRTASMLVSAMAQPTPGLAPIRRHQAHPTRPRLAVVSPFPPKKSGISTYVCRLISELKAEYRVELFHDSGYVPDAGLPADGLPCFDHRLLPRYAADRDYRAILYQMGNSPYHGFMYDSMSSHPGIVTLHDFSLGGFQYWRASESSDPEAAFRAEVEYAEPDRATEILPDLAAYRDESGGVQDALTRRGIHLNRRVLDSAEAVVVHSRWCAERCGQMDPALAAKCRVVPHGATASASARSDRESARAQFGIDPDTLVFASFGFLSRGKMNVEALRAFAEIAAEFPSAVFLFAGQDCEGGEARAAANDLGIAHRARFLGRRDDSEFSALMQAVDIGVALRRPPTYGETSGALLDLLRHGVATIASDTGPFAAYPDDVVRKVVGHEELVIAMRSLARDSEARIRLGSQAIAFLEANHAWPRVAAQYAQIIEQTWAKRSGLRRTHSQDPSFQHPRTAR